MPVIIVKCLGSWRCLKSIEVPEADTIQSTEQGWNKETPEEIVDRIRRMSEGCGFDFKKAYAETWASSHNATFSTFDSWNINVGCGFNRKDYEMILERMRREK